MQDAITYAALSVSGLIIGLIISWILAKRSEDAQRAYSASLQDARAVYADDDVQDDLTVIPDALRRKANG